MKFLFLILLNVTLSLYATPWVQTIPLPNKSLITSLIYGNEELGFFEIKWNAATQKRKSLSIVPPAYGKKIILAWKQNATSPYTCSYQSFAAPASHGDLIKAGQFTPTGDKLSVPYVLMNAHVGSKETGTSLVYIVNKLGQIIWSHSPPTPPKPSTDVRTLTLTVKALGEGRYALMRPYEQSYFEIVNTEHQVLSSLEPRLAKIPYPLHHDFILDNHETLLSLGHTKVYAKKWWKFWGERNSFLSIPLLRIDLKTNVATSLWHYLQGKNPFHEIDWTFNSEDSGSFWYLWGEKNAENNFEHINSIQKVGSEGYLLSLRSLNKLVLLSPDFKNIVWTIGKHPKNTYSPASIEADFYRQHHVTQLEDNNLLLFDNGKTKSRILLLRRNESLHTTELVRSYEPPEPYLAMRHGSAYELANRNILGFFPNTVPERKGPNYLYEFDRDSTKVKGGLKINFGINRVAYRAIPLTQLMSETYLGSQNPTPCH